MSVDLDDSFCTRSDAEPSFCVRSDTESFCDETGASNAKKLRVISDNLLEVRFTDSVSCAHVLTF